MQIGILKWYPISPQGDKPIPFYTEMSINIITDNIYISHQTVCEFLW